jgi:KipI family sensor histidine kinase inhibitor
LAEIRPLGDGAVTVIFGQNIDAATHERVLGFCAALEQADLPGVIEWAPAFASATIWHDPVTTDFEALRDALAPLAKSAGRRKIEGASYEIPFCCDGEFSPDLAETAALKGLTPEAYIEAFAAVTFEVYMLGFQPGFAYLGGLPESLSAPRLATPRKNVPALSLAIADTMCAAYPFASPGGWRLIGRTPAPLFDARNVERPAMLACGDKLRWLPVSRADYETLEARRVAGSLDAAQCRLPA